MQISPIKTPIVTAGSVKLFDLLDAVTAQLQDGDILAVSSKIVALCENNVRPATTDRDKLIAEESEYYLPASFGHFGYHYSITGHTLIGGAGIDSSNSDNHLVLWPSDPQGSANSIRAHVRERFQLSRLGVVITDSASQPLRLGSIGIAIAHSGFASLHDYRGQPDLFGRPLKVSRSNVASGLAAAAVLAMGEGAEQTPLCIIHDVPSIEFQNRDPTAAELADLRYPLEEDLFAPFLLSAPWQVGERKHSAE